MEKNNNNNSKKYAQKTIQPKTTKKRKKEVVRIVAKVLVAVQTPSDGIIDNENYVKA